MITDMERIGDQAADISEISISLAGEPDLPKMDIIRKMAAESMLMVVNSIEAFVTRDIEQAEQVRNAKDDEIDQLFADARSALIEIDPEGDDQAGGGCRIF